MPGFYRVYGSRGWLEVGSFNYADIRLQASYVNTPGTPPTKLDETNPERDPMQFTREADHFTDCILHDRTPQPSGERGPAGHAIHADDLPRGRRYGAITRRYGA